MYSRKHLVDKSKWILRNWELSVASAFCVMCLVFEKWSWLSFAGYSFFSVCSVVCCFNPFASEGCVPLCVCVRGFPSCSQAAQHTNIFRQKMISIRETKVQHKRKQAGADIPDCLLLHLHWVPLSEMRSLEKPCTVLQVESHPPHWQRPHKQLRHTEPNEM